MTRIIIYLLGFMFTTLGFFYFICYTNLFTFGYSFSEYLNFMFTHYKTYSLLLGIILLIISIYGRREKR
ncbi:MAG: hypothetical protein LKJ84_03425 [Bacilli bacterium]|nr:hypothetical protein [Bacilli bacterium]MDD6418868.1 hypothetical protein [Clostridium sp.]